MGKGQMCALFQMSASLSEIRNTVLERRYEKTRSVHKSKCKGIIMLKKGIALSAALTLLLMAGCGEKEKSCTLTVNSHYSGWGEDGQFLGEGEDTFSFTVKAGDIFYENYSGEWITENRDKYPFDTIAEIKSIEPDKIVWVYNGNECSTRFDRCSEVKSVYTVCDGINYDYKVTFSDYSEK